MKKNYIDNLKEVLANKSSMTPEKLQSFMGQTMQYLTELRTKLTSKEPKDREEAMNTAMELKDVLEAQMGALTQAMGIDFSQLNEKDLMDQMNDSEREVFITAKEQFSDLKNSIHSNKENKKKEIIKSVM